MKDQAYATFTKEYTTNDGVLIIENVFNIEKSRRDVIREIVEREICLGDMSLVQSASRNTVDCSSHSKEAVI